MSSATLITSLPAATGNDEEDPSPDTSHLCGYCKRLEFKIKDICQGRDDGTFQSWEAISAAAPTCAMCKRIVEHNRSKVETAFRSESLRLSAEVREGQGVYSLRVLHPKTATYISEFYLLVDIDSAAAKERHISGRHIKAANDLGCAELWLKNCLENHNHGSSREALRPSRLIAVGTENGSVPIRLVNSPAIKDNYFALSHCWGEGLSFKLSTRTLLSFQAEIPWNQLPLTFQDAIQITRRLGFHYLWIDALCIVQDDPQDWEAESAIMGSVYNNATLTIMAVSASNSRGGCFRERSEKEDRVLLPYTDHSGIMALEIYICFNPLPPSGYDPDLEGGPLFKRAWVLQERFISKRKIYFGDIQLYWDCGDIFESENQALRQTGSSPWPLRLRAFSEEPEAQAMIRDPAYKSSELWEMVIENYSSCNLTFASDIFPGLSGLARAYAQGTGFKYLAGLWLEEMPLSLLWRPKPILPHSHEEYRSPTWSWASIRGKCFFVGDGSRYYRQPASLELEIVHTDMRLASADPFGRVLPGSRIVVRGRIRAVRLARMSEEYHNPYNTKHRSDPFCVIDDEGAAIGRPFLDHHRDPVSKELEVSILEVMYCKRGSSNESWFLILQATSHSKDFQRIGIGRASPCESGFKYMFSGLEKVQLGIV
ncbi:hypothetical protein VTL71DRAFT_808 [Oculimacula yallundae]|uniref:Heterokaryon incompatibility domain-containing protein n=1 Tax=Oculimacula yallundae TaxID=86028 RepID=A0ABR4D129_9HELO